MIIIRLTFQESIEKWQIQYGEERAQGVILAKIRAECGGQAGLDEAIERGDVWSSKDEDGREWYYSRSVSAVRRTGTTDKTHINKGQKELSDGELRQLNTALKKFEWNVPKSAADRKLAIGGSDEVDV